MYRRSNSGSTIPTGLEQPVDRLGRTDREGQSPRSVHDRDLPAGPPKSMKPSSIQDGVASRNETPRALSDDPRSVCPPLSPLRSGLMALEMPNPRCDNERRVRAWKEITMTQEAGRQEAEYAYERVSAERVA